MRPAVLNWVRATTADNFPLDELKALEIPLPTLTEQQRIAKQLQKADRLRRIRHHALQMCEELLPAAFLKMFGEPVGNERGWPVEQLGDLGQVSTGGTPPSSKQGMFGTFVPFITPGDLEDDTFKATRFLSKAGAEYVGTVRSGSTLVCCIGATIGKTDIARIRSAFNQQINAVEWGGTVNDAYGAQLMRFFSKIVAVRGRSTTLPNLTFCLYSLVQQYFDGLSQNTRGAYLKTFVQGLSLSDLANVHLAPLKPG